MKLEKSLEGKRIRLRNYRAEDLDFVKEMWLDSENGKYMSDPTEEYLDEEYCQAMAEMQNSEDGYYLIAEFKDSEKLLGSCCAFPNETGKAMDIGYCIHKDYWKQGYASEMLQLLLDWFKQSGVEKVTADVAVENPGSNALLKKFGFQAVENGQFKKYHMDVTFDQYTYTLLLK